MITFVIFFQVIRYVSWNEFVHHMLAKGEVEEVIVRPDVDIVTIILHDGAIIKGKRVRNKTHKILPNRYFSRLEAFTLTEGCSVLTQSAM
jgi:hypothetical protein